MKSKMKSNMVDLIREFLDNPTEGLQNEIYWSCKFDDSCHDCPLHSDRPVFKTFHCLAREVSGGPLKHRNLAGLCEECKSPIELWVFLAELVGILEERGLV